MSNVYELSSNQQRFDEASVWVAKLDKGLSAEDKQALQRWLAADPDNRALFLNMVQLWDKMDSLSRLSDIFPRPAKQRRGASVLAVAASIFIAVAVGLWGFVAVNNPASDRPVVAHEKVYQTAVGEQLTVSLPDSTRLVLNTDSLLRVNYSDQYRLLVLERGELHIDVAEDQSRPLSVYAGEQIVQAVGTAFNVQIIDEQTVELVVTEGKVRVATYQPERSAADSIEPTVLPASSLLVSQGRQLILGAPEEVVEDIESADIEIKLSWRKGNLVFQGESLEEAIAEISRYTSVEFVILDDSLKAVRVAGLFKAGDVDGLLVTLRENFNISYQRLDEKVLLRSYL